MDAQQLHGHFIQLYAVLDGMGWYMTLSWLFCAIIIYLLNGKVNSQSLTVIIFCLSLMLMKAVKATLKFSAGMDMELYRHFWYIMYISAYTLTLYLLYKSHQYTNIKLSKYSKFVFFSVFILGNMVFIKYIFRMYLGIDNEFIRLFYMSGVNAIKLSVSIATLILTITYTGLSIKNKIKG